MRATVNMSPLIADSRSTPIDGARAERAQPAGDGMAVALRHLVLRRDREAHAEIDEGLELRVGEVVAVDDVDVRADQAVAPSAPPSRPASWPRRRPGASRRQAELPGQREVVRADVERRIVRAEHRHAERHQRVAVRQRPAASAARSRSADAGPRRNAARRAWDRAWASRGRRRRGCRFPSSLRRRRRCARGVGLLWPSRPASSRHGRAGSARRPGWRYGCRRA